MATMSLDDQIKKYLPLLGKEKKKSILSEIKSYLSLKEAPKKMTREEFIIQYNKELDEAEARMDAGDFYTQEEVEEMSKKW
jgi:hypothetical protein